MIITSFILLLIIEVSLFAIVIDSAIKEKPISGTIAVIGFSVLFIPCSGLFMAIQKPTPETINQSLLTKAEKVCKNNNGLWKVSKVIQSTNIHYDVICSDGTAIMVSEKNMESK
jgi:hypothetical protein